MDEPRGALRLGNIKGFAFSEFLTWYGHRCGRPTVTAALAAARAKHPVELDLTRDGFGILASQWYSAEFVHAVLDEVMRNHSTDELHVIVTEAAQAIMDKMLRGMYRAVFAICVTPERYVRHVDKVWRLQYDSGQPIILATHPKEHRIHYRDWRSHHPLICRLNMASARPIYGAMGCQETRYTPLSCVSTGAARCESVVAWK